MKVKKKVNLTLDVEDLHDMLSEKIEELKQHIFVKDEQYRADEKIKMEMGE